MDLTVNGEPHHHRGQGRIDELLAELGAKPAQTALLLNGVVLPRARWPEARLAENDAVEVLVFAGGG